MKSILFIFAALCGICLYQNAGNWVLFFEPIIISVFFLTIAYFITLPEINRGFSLYKNAMILMAGMCFGISFIYNETVVEMGGFLGNALCWVYWHSNLITVCLGIIYLFFAPKYYKRIIVSESA